MWSHFSPRKSEKKACSRWYRPRIEALEERALLSLVTWTGNGGANNNWSNPANWDHGVPNAGHALHSLVVGLLHRRSSTT
jgi:hypothetical protein